MKEFLGTMTLLFALTPSNVFSQSSSATVSGTVADVSGGVLPGVSLSAVNNATGVVTTVISNEAGAYNFASLLPGTYTVSADLPGFQKRTYTSVQLGNAQQVRLNFTLQVASQAQSVEVTVAVDTLIATSSSSVGEVLPESRIRDLGIVGNNVLDLINVLPGFRAQTPDGVFGQDNNTFAGVSARNANIQRDGVTADAGGRYPTGIQAATRMNPDLIGEVRLILTPVDAEMGRGNGQVQLLTRSGTNQFHGSAVLSERNTALDANTWQNNRTIPVAPPRDWRNLPQYTLSLGGPIVKNKTFFFALWDGIRAPTRSSVNSIVLTPCARNGVFRYYDLWNNGGSTQIDTFGPTPLTAVVDDYGNARPPARNPDGSAANGILRYASVFGKLENIPTKPDCSDAIVTPNSAWDPYRTGFDATGYVKKVISTMPAPNNWDGTSPNIVTGGTNTVDGLNTALFRWVRHLRGSNNLFSIGEEQDRDQVNLKFDHNFNANNKINTAWTYERAHSDDAYATFPGGWGGTHYSRPMVLTTNFTSTLSPSIVNEARFGMRRTGSNPISPIETPGSGEEIKKYIFNFAGTPMWPHMGPTAFGFQNSQLPGGRGTIQITSRDITTLWTYADTISWIKGKHSFKGGAQILFDKSKGIQNGLGFGNNDTIFGTVLGGDAPLAPLSTTAISTTNMPGLGGTSVTGNNQRMRGLLSYLAGSVATINQAYFVNSPNNLSDWVDYRTSQYVIRDFHQNELAFFFKDDWKVQKNLTLNLGLRYEYYGVPYEANGLTGALSGGGSAAFGISKDFSGWMTPGVRGNLTTLQFIGPNSPNAGQQIYASDRNNFGPAIGFAWQLPWFGEGKTTIRGGYQVTYQGAQRGGDLQSANGFIPGSIFRAQFTGTTGNEYIDLTSIGKFTPVPPAANGVLVKPMQPIAITDRTQSIQAYDPNFVTPYVQNMTLAVTRILRPNLVLDVKYVGTLGVKQYQNINLNIPNFLYNGLKDAFDAVRAGNESPLLDNIFRGIAIVGTTPVGTGGQTASAQLRADSRFNTNLANGNYAAVASTLATLNYSQAGGANANLPPIPLGVNGAVLRVNGYPENFILPNPQFVSGIGPTGLSTTAGVIYRTNLAHNNYHSMESQLTLRPTRGLNLQETYTWSKNLGNPGVNAFTNPVDRHGEYTIQAGDRTHDFRTNGSFELPFGPSRLLLGNSSGWLARTVEGWQLSGTFNVNSGAPLTISTFANNIGVNQLYTNGTPDIVGPFPFSDSSARWGGVKTSTGLLYGSYWDPAAFKTVRDPQCDRLAANLQSLCTLTGVADNKNGQILLQNPLPGTRGTLGQNAIRGPSVWRFNAAVRKEIKISEAKNLQFRIDAFNVLNHATPQTPNLNINNTSVPFGTITTKTPGITEGFFGFGATARSLQAQVRFNF